MTNKRKKILKEYTYDDTLPDKMTDAVARAIEKFNEVVKEIDRSKDEHT